MFGMETFIKTWQTESRICVNLFGKMPPGGLDYRPSPAQRNTLELMRYLSYGPYNGLYKIIAGDWNAGKPTAEMTAGMPASDFADRMAWQSEAAARIIRSTPESVYKLTTVMPWGETVVRGEGIFMYPLRWLTGYRMQLFLYLKAAGAHQLATADCWRVPAPAAA